MNQRLLIVTSLLWTLHAASGMTLDAVMQQTLEKNPEIQRAKLNLEAAAGRRLVLRSIAWPDLKAGAPAGVQGGTRAGESGVKGFGFLRGFLTQPLVNAAIPASFRRGDVEVLIAEQQLNLAIEQQLHLARVAFYSALYNRQLLAVREKQREHLNENVSSQQGRYRAGLVNRGALMAADSQAREVDPLVEGARRAYSGAQLQLAQSMALDVKSDDALPNPEGELRFAHVDVDVPTATATALQERTDIKLARLLVRAANEDERIIAAGYCPAVNGSVTGDYIPVTGIHREGSTSRVDDFLGSEVREGAALSWQVIDNGKVSGPLIRQRKAREINEVELHKLETGVGRELARIRNDLLGIEAKHNSLVSGSQNARRAATAIQENLSSGLSSELEYRVAESSALKTESGLLEASYLQNVSLAEWDRATGRYFQFIEDMR